MLLRTAAIHFFHRFLAREAFQSLAFCFRNKERSKATAQHEQSKDLHNVVQPPAISHPLRSTFVDQGTKDTLRDDCAHLPEAALIPWQVDR